MNKYNKLDNPVWNSLSEKHQKFSIDYGDIKFYHPDYCPFGGFKLPAGIATYIEKYTAMVDSIFIVGDMPELSNEMKLKKELVCLQMIIDDRIDLDIEEDIVALTQAHGKSLFELVNLVQPGYFKNKTALLGNYFGIFKDDRLVAATGERMKMDDFTEVSAIVTHPNYTGNGYAKQLIAHAVNNIFSLNKTPYLHVVETNTLAIKLYEKLGFKRRRKISFWNIVKSVNIDNINYNDITA